MYLKEGTLLKGGEYKIVRHISSGGFGNTYEGIDVNLDKKVAIKEFFVKDFCSRESDTTLVTISVTAKKPLINHLKQKFIDEARAIARMEHENIVKVQSLFEENGTAYYVMDYIDGESLGDVLKRRGSLPEQEAVAIILKVASALDYMHKQNRFHLDVKPANIMLRKDGKVVLIDFGSSKQYAEVDGENTTTLAPCYTPGYAPTEQMNPKPTTYTAATDVYALGATLYKMLTGITPPSAIDLVNGEETLSPLPDEVSKNVKECVAMAMIPQRNQRMQSVGEFAEMMAATSAPKPPKPPKVQNPQKNNSSSIMWLWAVIAIVVIAGASYGVYYYINNRNDSKGETPLDSIPQEPSPQVYSDTYTIKDVSFKMIKVNGGTFTMGATSEQENPNDDEKPTHKVTLSTYYIGQTEVTQGLWEAVMDNNPSNNKGFDLPVEQVSWNDCQEFIKKLNQLTGKDFRLPTEAEWEFAARGGNKSNHYQYCGSSNIDEIAWCRNNSGDNYLSDEYFLSHNNNGGGTFGGALEEELAKYKDNNCKPHHVATKQANELGIFDMSGNVQEWCSDWYGDYNSSAQTNPTGPNNGNNRVCRGGDWSSGATDCRSSNRDNRSPKYGGLILGSIGLRLCLSE